MVSLLLCSSGHCCHGSGEMQLRAEVMICPCFPPLIRTDVKTHPTQIHTHFSVCLCWRDMKHDVNMASSCNDTVYSCPGDMLVYALYSWLWFVCSHVGVDVCGQHKQDFGERVSLGGWVTPCLLRESRVIRLLGN